MEIRLDWSSTGGIGSGSMGSITKGIEYPTTDEPIASESKSVRLCVVCEDRLKRLGTQVHSVLIIPPALTTLNNLVSSLHEVWDSDNGSVSSISSCRFCWVSPYLVDSEYGLSVIQQLQIMQETEKSKLQKCEEWSVPQGVSIDANEQVNGCFLVTEWILVLNIEYDKFLDWLKHASNHELYVRIKKFVTSVNSILPKDTPGEREVQSENLNLSIRSFVKEVLLGAEIEDSKRELYQRFMLKFLNIMCYDKVELRLFF